LDCVILSLSVVILSLSVVILSLSKDVRGTEVRKSALLSRHGSTGSP
jgi:hypothetical protein